MFLNLKNITNDIKLIGNKSAGLLSAALSGNKLFLKHFSRILEFLFQEYLFCRTLLPMVSISHANRSGKPEKVVIYRAA